jgi:FlaA1/EpsC-like NDP-sugar epimerase
VKHSGIPQQRTTSPQQTDFRTHRTSGTPALIVGAGQAGTSLARDLHRVQSFGLTPIGFLDDDPLKQGRRYRGTPVMGTVDDLELVLERTGADVVVIAIPSMSSVAIRALARRAALLGARVRHLPPFLAALQREIAGSDMRDLQVGSLIGRDEMRVVSPGGGGGAAAAITGKRVLVTGAGGSIGSELCRQLYAFGPSDLVMLDHDESNLHRLHLELWGEASMDADNVMVADIRDTERIHQIFREQRPQVVFHAAALKHLPVLERHPCEGVKSNVLGTENLVEASIAFDVERFVLISTDKAANPTSVLGATKRLAELVLQAHAGSTTVLSAVRFGNVLGSRGSLLHVIREQLACGSQVTVTDPEVTRFFMTIEEAVGLVLEAARMADASATYVLDMGEPVKIVDLARQMIRLAGLRPDVDVPVRFTGLRPGEKLFEEMFHGREPPAPTEYPGLLMAKPRTADAAIVGRAIEEIAAACRAGQQRQALGLLSRMVPEFEHNATGSSGAAQA